MDKEHHIDLIVKSRSHVRVQELLDRYIETRAARFPQRVNSRKNKPMTEQAKGIVSKPSSYSVEETARRFESVLKAKGVMLFATVDHSGEAEKAGMKLRPTKLLIFGNPKAGTPLMEASPLLAIDLPLKALIWEDDDRGIWVSYQDPLNLEERYAIPPDLLKNIAVVAALIDQALAGQTIE